MATRDFGNDVPVLGVAEGPGAPKSATLSNLPSFDPLDPTPQEQADMLQGYLDGYSGKPIPTLTSIAYDHGRRNGVNDKAGISDLEQRALARRAARLPSPLSIRREA